MTAEDPLQFRCGSVMKNRIGLSAMTTWQSHPDGTASNEERNWLAMRAEGGFGLVATCCAHVSEDGQGFEGQLGIFSDHHIAGLCGIAGAIKAYGALALVQLYHGGFRAPRELTAGILRSPYDVPELGVTAMTRDEIENIVEAFVTSAVRAQAAGFDGIELHGGHGYLLSQFLDADRNVRKDGFGMTHEGRTRIFHDIVSRIRSRTGPGFVVGVRHGAESEGMTIANSKLVAAELLASGTLDFLDVSTPDVFGFPRGRLDGPRLIDQFAELPRHGTRLALTGAITGASQVRRALANGADIVLVGRAAIRDHDFVHHALEDPDFIAQPFPATEAELAREGVSPAFLRNIRKLWPDWVTA